MSRSIMSLIPDVLEGSQHYVSHLLPATACQIITRSSIDDHRDFDKLPTFFGN